MGIAELEQQLDKMKQNTNKIVDIKEKKAEKEKQHEENKMLEYMMRWFPIDENGKMTFEPVVMGEDLVKDFVKVFFDGNLTYYYQDGLYFKQGEKYLSKLIQGLMQTKARQSRIREVLSWIQNHTYTESSKINANDGLINVKNGLLNARTGELLPHNPERLSTIQLDVEYDPDANDENVMEFLKSILPEDTIDTVLEMIGYCLVPTTRYEKAFMLTGTGANGKSTFINMITAMIGKDNISNIPLQDLESNRFKSAQLNGKLLNTFADIPHIALDKSSVFKSLVSGDRISAEFKGKDSFDFKPFAKLIFSANEIPSSRDTTDGFFRRWIIIPFPNQFTSDKADVRLIDKLTTPQAKSTLLNLAIEALKCLEQNGKFTENETTKEMLEQYKRDTDNVVTFVEESCTFGEEFTYSRNDLFKEYIAWCNESGLKHLGKIKFNKRIEEKYKLKHKRPTGEPHVWLGITMNHKLPF